MSLTFRPVKPGKALIVTELARLIRAYAETSSLEAIALKSVMVMPALLLQKPSRTSRAKDHSTHLERRLHLWKNGSFEELVREARVSQNHLNTLNIRTGEENRPQKFAKFMRTGQTNAALRMLSDGIQGHSLPLDQLCSTGETVGSERF